MMKLAVNTEFEGFHVTGTLIVGDWEGDPSIPRGTREIPPYLDDFRVEAGGHNHTDHLTPEYLAHLESRAIRALSEGGPL